MSARDAESGSSTYKGGSGRAGGLGNGGIGGGMGGGGNYGGGRGGGAGRNGGIGSRTGLTTGNVMKGGVAKGRPGGKAMNPGAWGMDSWPSVSRAPLNRPAVPGLLSQTPVPTAIPGVNPVPEYVPQLPDMYTPPYMTPETVPGVPTPPTASNPWSADVDYDWALAAPRMTEYANPYTTNLSMPNPYNPAYSPGNVRPAGNYGSVRTGRNSSEFGMNRPGYSSFGDAPRSPDTGWGR